MLRIIIVLLCMPLFTLAQVGIGTSQPEPSAQLEVKSTNKGFLPPRVALTSTTDNATISTPVAGLLVYCIGTGGLAAGYYYWSGDAWVRVALSNEVVSSVGTISNTSNSKGATIASGALSLTPADATNGGIVTNSVQTFSGDKNFINNIGINGNRVGSPGVANSQNTMFGNASFAWAANVGTDNTAFGHFTLSTNNGNNNTAVGSNAMRQGNTGIGSYNVAVGSRALSNGIDGNYNTGVGYSSLDGNTGSYNVSIGSLTLLSNQGNYNVSVGYEAVKNNTAGSNNVGVGKQAGLINTIGSDNTFIGANSNAGVNDLSNATAIGYGATVTAPNSMQLGDNRVVNVKTSGTLSAGAVTYPNTHGTNGQVLTTNGAGALSWSAPGGPTGTILMFAGASAPTGYLICDGSAVNRTTYASLFAIIGTTYGTGDGSNTFNLPDLRGRVPVGSGLGAGLTNRTLGSLGGAETHTLTTSEMPSHTHTITDPGHSHTSRIGKDDGNLSNGNGQAPVGDADQINDIKNGYATTSNITGITISSTGSGQAHNNMQPYIVLNFIIKF